MKLLGLFSGGDLSTTCQVIFSQSLISRSGHQPELVKLGGLPAGVEICQPLVAGRLGLECP